MKHQKNLKTKKFLSKKTLRQENRKTVFVAMSGGVDSSVAALLLKQQGFDVVGVFMKNWTEKAPGLVYCPWEEDQRSARMAAAKIGIPFYTWDFEVEYKKIVFHDFISGYQKGETPNPDVLCNKEIKFGLFLKKARKLGADFIATGHYVGMKKSPLVQTAVSKTPAVFGRLRSRGGDSESFFSLRVARDANKDQSYFLWTLKQPQLKYCLFPLGNLTKPQVRQIAEKAGLPNAKRKDSQGLCFVGSVRLKDFLKPYIKEKPGKIVRVSFSKDERFEEIIGWHQGMHLFTLGQRSGMGVGGGRAYFVCAKNKKKDILYVCEKKDLARFFAKKVLLKKVNWINPREKFPEVCRARYRYRQPLVRVAVKKEDRGFAVFFAKPPVAITPGQSIVFYKGKKMLGGGVIQ